MEGAVDFAQFSFMTYAGPHMYLEAFLDLILSVIELGKPLRLPVSLSANLAPRETFFNKESWGRFESRIRKGRVSSCRISQYLYEGMTMHSFLPRDRPLPFTITAEFVPEDGIPSESKKSPFDLVNMLGVKRYPSGIALEIDCSAFPGEAPSDVLEGMTIRFKDLFLRAGGAFACIENREMFRCGVMQMSPSLLRENVLIENLDSLIPGIFWGMFLGPGHIEKLGGKTAVVDALANCRVDDLSTADGDRLYIQLTDRIEDFNDEAAKMYRPFFKPIIVERDEGEELEND
jgi:hypothetical protein